MPDYHIDFDHIRLTAAPEGAVVEFETDAQFDAERRQNISLQSAEFSYINVYLVDRAYGGPEEGGWYYDYGNPVESRRVRVDWPQPSGPYTHYMDEDTHQLEFLKLRYDRLNEGRPSVHSVLSEGRYKVIEEDRFARSWPEKTPHYE